MFHNKIAIILIFSLFIVFVQYPGQANTEQPENQLVFAISTNFGEANLFSRTLSYSDKQWMSTIFTGLYARDSSNNREFSPVLAKNMPTIQIVNESDGTLMIITIEIKSGLLFSNEVPLTTEDIAYTYQLYLNPSVNSRYNSLLTRYFNNGSDIVEIDNTHVQFRFKNITGNYLKYISLPIVPEEIYRPAVENGIYDFTGTNFIIGAGPYKLVTFDQDNKVITVNKNPNWKKTGFPEPVIEQIIFKHIQKDDAITSFEKKEVDILDPFYSLKTSEVSNLSEAIYKVVPDGFIRELSINHIHPVWGHTAQIGLYLNKTFNWNATGKQYTIHSFWNDISQGTMNENERIEAARLVREAMSYTIPREQLANQNFPISGYPLSTVIPPETIGWLDLKPRQYNLTKAKQLIVQAFKLAGWNNITIEDIPNLSDMFPQWTINLMIPDIGGTTTDMMYKISSELPKIGIRVNQTLIYGWQYIAPRSFTFPLTKSDYDLPDGTHTPVPLWNQGGYDTLLIGYLVDLNPEIPELYESTAFLPYGGNFYNYYNPSYDQISKAYRTELDPNKKLSQFQQVQQHLYEYQPSIPIIASARLVTYRNGITGIDPVLLFHQAQQWWLISKISPTNTSTTSPSSTSVSFLSFPLIPAYLLFVIIVVAIPVRKNMKHK